MEGKKDTGKRKTDDDEKEVKADGKTSSDLKKGDNYKSDNYEEGQAYKINGFNGRKTRRTDFTRARAFAPRKNRRRTPHRYRRRDT